MKLLIDQSLAPGLASALADLFPGSLHAREAGLARAEDADLWLRARDGGYVLLCKSPEFTQRATLLGHPPKVVWLRGDCSTPQLIDALRRGAERLRSFDADPDRCLLTISPAPAQQA